MAERKRFRHALEGQGFGLLMALLAPLPRAAAARLATALGRLAFDGFRVRRRVAVDNVLARLRPAGGPAEAKRIARQSYAVMARTFIDLLRLDRIDDATLWRMLSRREFDELRRTLEGGGVLVSGHFGNWELLALGIRRTGVPVCAMAADQANARVDRHVKGARLRAGLPTHSARRGLRDVQEALARGEYVATLLDQDARRKGVFVDFLGAPAACHTGVVKLAIRSGKPLIPGVLVDGGSGTYRLVRGPVWSADPSRTEEENERDGTTVFHRFLEEQVRAHPGNYLWAHRRWKTSPPAGAAESAA